ncbi:hypothetical protein [Xanthomonas phage X1]|nr:hypothetical protein [Xanthomonas phage X1]
MKIRIEWTSDSSDCETCGCNFADGANVYIDEVLALEFIPIAHCYDGDDFTRDYVYAQILKHLGHEVIEG